MPKPLRAIIVDDERLARAKIRRFLEDYGAVEIIAECANGMEALTVIGEQALDVIFLDVQMPEMSGFEVLRLLGESHLLPKTPPLVVFVTAFDHYAVAAFQENALDYIVKPFDYERFSVALRRVEETISVAAAARHYHELTWRVVEEQSQKQVSNLRFEERFVFKSRGKISLVATPDIDWIEAEGNYAVFHVGKARYLLRETLSALETRLDPAMFLRIHRSAIVRVSFLNSLEQHEDGSYHAIMRDGTRWGVGPTYRDAVRRALSL